MSETVGVIKGLLLRNRYNEEQNSGTHLTTSSPEQRVMLELEKYKNLVFAPTLFIDGMVLIDVALSRRVSNS